jgi:hypothetical protein
MNDKLQQEISREGQIIIANQTYDYQYCKRYNVATSVVTIIVTVNDLKIICEDGKSLEYQGDNIPRYNKVCNTSIDCKLDRKDNNVTVHHFPYANFYCYSQNGKLYQPVYSEETNQSEHDILLVNDHLYGSYRDKYNNLTIYHHGLIMNRHVKNGKFMSIPAHMYDLAVILNEISPSLHYILLV